MNDGVGKGDVHVVGLRETVELVGNIFVYSSLSAGVSLSSFLQQLEMQRTKSGDIVLYCIVLHCIAPGIVLLIARGFTKSKERRAASVATGATTVHEADEIPEKTGTSYL